MTPQLVTIEVKWHPDYGGHWTVTEDEIEVMAAVGEVVKYKFRNVMARLQKRIAFCLRDGRFIRLVVYRKDGKPRYTKILKPDGFKWNRHEVRFVDNVFIYPSCAWKHNVWAITNGVDILSIENNPRIFNTKNQAISDAVTLCRENQPATLRIRNKDGTHEDRWYPKWLKPKKSKG